MAEREDSKTKVEEDDKNSKWGEQISISKRSLWFMAGGDCSKGRRVERRICSLIKTLDSII
ncbi:MAG: hypothetical protein Q8P28_10280 [Deltaproteobacteria bacterium]|nr:hypothetical protein [Deltaproteobacteria bacterium]